MQLPLQALIYGPSTLHTQRLSAVLQSMSVIAYHTVDRDEVIELVTTSKIHGAFIDWDSEELDGPGLAVFLRRSRSNATVPLTQLTKSIETQTFMAANEAGVNYMLPIPFGTAHLQSLVRAMNAEMWSEYRRYERVACPGMVVCYHQGTSIIGESIDMSSSGVLARLSDPIRLGEPIELQLSNRRFSGVLSVKGHAVRTNGAHTAFEFTEIATETLEKLNAQIEACRG